jgi:16S rRNA A1518/A1519 N6-dimethyltransferase RsmA/KsgA/DIM1 with predicted DNA glycosylase/AP lyase activity
MANSRSVPCPSSSPTVFSFRPPPCVLSAAVSFKKRKAPVRLAINVLTSSVGTPFCALARMSNGGFTSQRYALRSAPVRVSWENMEG